MVVVHHRARDPFAAAQFAVHQVLASDGGGGLEVVSQAQCVAHLMGDGVFDVGLRQRLGLGAVGFNLTTRLQQVQRKTQLAACFVCVHTRLIMGVAPQRSARLRRLGKGRHQAALGGHETRAARKAFRHTNVGIQNLTGSRVSMRRPERAAGVQSGVPTNGSVPRVHGVEAVVICLLLHDDGVFKADALKGLVPFQDAGLNRPAVTLRNVLVQPVGDGLDGLGQSGSRIFLLKTPTFDVTHATVQPQVV